MPRGLQVPYSELDRHIQESPTGDGSNEVQITHRVYKLAFSDLTTAIPQLLGYPTRITANNLSRYLPHQDPQFPKLIATSYSWKPLGKAISATNSYGKYNTYAEVALNVTFTRPMYAVLSDAENTTLGIGEQGRFTTVDYKPEGSYLVLNAVSGSYLWAGGPTNASQTGLGTQINQNFTQGVSKLIAETNLIVTWHQIPYDYLPDISGTIGKINKGPMALEPGPSALYDYGGNELLLLGANLNRICLSTGDLGWNIQYLMKYNPNRWNYFYNPKASDRTRFYQVTVQVPGTQYAVFYDPASQTLPDGAAAYDERSFQELFQVV